MFLAVDCKVTANNKVYRLKPSFDTMCPEVRGGRGWATYQAARAVVKANIDDFD